MKIVYGFSVLVLLLLTKVSLGQQCPIIPLPNQYESVDDSFLLDESTVVIVQEDDFNQEARFLKNQILKYTGISVSGKSKASHQIVLQSGETGKLEKDGAYRINMGKNKITIRAAHKDGAFYGVISLLQIIAGQHSGGASVSLPCWDIMDSPHYAWRGFMLDESRHFFGKEMVKKVLDQMAWHKLNRFHWHLTDAPGWRLSIKKYPLLSVVGGIGNYSDPNAPAQYYTQADIREIVAYAQKRHIEIIPEIDMPGHATAANRAYPEFSGGGTGKYADFTFNPGKEGSYGYLTQILREVSVLFPSGLIHLGGDEVSFGIKSWAKDSGVKRLMKRDQLKNLKGVEHYFFHRMVDSSLQIFRKVLAWDEAADGSLPTDSTIILWWRHDQPAQLAKALSKGYKVVLCPRIPMYFDFVQNKNHVDGRRWAGKFSTVKQVYEFSDTTYAAGKTNPDLIIGMQGNLWTETVKTDRRLEFLIFPRMDALSEAAWTRASNKDYDGFLSRLKNQMERYKKENLYFYNPISPEKTPEVVD